MSVEITNNNIQYVKIGDIAAKEKYSCVGGPFGSSLSRKHYVDDEAVPVIRGTNLNSDQFIDDGFVFVSEEKGDALHRNMAYCGDIVFTQRGTLGQVALIPDTVKFKRYVVSQSQMKLTVNNEIADPYYVYSYFRSQEAKKVINNRAIIGGVPHINLGILKAIEIPLPSLIKQKKITSIIKSLDDKIQLNSQLNQTLEQIAQAIFKSWFVNFEPTKAKIAAREALFADLADASKENSVATAGQTGKALSPEIIAEAERQAAIQVISAVGDIASTEQLETLADLFPNQLIDSELGEIPEGWDVTRFKPIVEKYIDNRGKTPPTVDSGIPLLEVKHLPENALYPMESTNKYVDEDTYNSWFRAHLEPDDIIISTVGTIGRICLMPENRKLTIAQNLLGMRFNREKASPIFMYYQMDGFRFRHDVDARLVITVQASIKRKDLETIDLLKPSIEIQNAFERIVKPIAQKQAPLENTTLEKLRDTLLPKLLSGEIALTCQDKEESCAS